jgi:hypothetical protein
MSTLQTHRFGEEDREPLSGLNGLLTRQCPDKLVLETAVRSALQRIDRNLEVFHGRFPGPASVKGVYPLIDNNEWTNGFWTGMLWLAFEFSGEERYRRAARSQLPSYASRLKQRVNVDHHDLGFLYTLSCVAAYKVDGDTGARDTALTAADLLLKRFVAKAGIIQAWGNLEDPAQMGRMIIDCNLNLPLLFWAAQVTGDQKYSHAADRHIETAAKYLVRTDASTFHTFFMDVNTGLPKRGTTHQGATDTSCWARGQAWGIAGFALAGRWTHSAALAATAARLANYFLNRLPDDLVCCWDLVFVDPSVQRDSSAAAIAACGLLELVKHLPLYDSDRALYEKAAAQIVGNLAAHYACAPENPGYGILQHGVYHMPAGIGVDESCIWGDYFYLEALMRLLRVWETYW